MVRTVSKRKYAIVYVFTALIFLVGLAVGWQISNYLVSDVKESNDVLRSQLIGLDLRDELLNEDICDVPEYILFEERLRIAREITELEDRLGKYDKEVLVQKEFYQLIELKTWLLVKNLNDNCIENYDWILFFYSNSKENNLDKISEDQGYVLDNFYSNNRDVVVFSFDIDTRNPALNTLKEIYNISVVPSLVINEDLYEGYQNYYQIEQAMG